MNEETRDKSDVLWDKGYDDACDGEEPATNDESYLAGYWAAGGGPEPHEAW